MLPSVTRLGDLRRNTLSWCRITRISACSAIRDRTRPTTAHQIKLHKSLIATILSADSQAIVTRVGFAVGTGRTGSNMGFGAKVSFGFAIAESAMRAFDQKSGAISCRCAGVAP